MDKYPWFCCRAFSLAGKNLLNEDLQNIRVTHRRISFFASIVNAMKYPNDPFVRFVFGFVGASDVGARSEVKIAFNVLK